MAKKRPDMKSIWAMGQTFPETETKTKAETETFTETFQEASPKRAAADLAEELRAARGRKRPKLEERRRRQTFLLDGEEIRMVHELARETGFRKYEIVSRAIRELYRRVMEER